MKGLHQRTDSPDTLQVPRTHRAGGANSEIWTSDPPYRGNGSADKASSMVSATRNCLALAKMLQDTGVLGEAKGQVLVRQLERTLQRLQQPVVTLALQYDKRRRMHGKTRARAWYRMHKRQRAETNAISFPASRIPDCPLTRDLVISFRSRHLRGPPRRTEPAHVSGM